MTEYTWEQIQERNRETVENCPEDCTTVWSVATGMVDVLNKESRQAARFIRKQPGFIGVHIPEDGRGVLWLFKTERDGRVAKWHMDNRGIGTGTWVCALNVEKKYLKEESR